MPTRTTKHAPESCGCQVTEYYSWSDCGNFDDGDSFVDFCDWHALKDDAFTLYIQWAEKNDSKQETRYDGNAEAYWIQYAERENELSEIRSELIWAALAQKIGVSNDWPF